MPKIATKLPKLADSQFTYENCADRNRVFLFENIDKPPFLAPVKGWKMVGYGTAPWPGTTDGFAVMFEKMTPPEEETGSMFQKRHLTLPEGTRIWQHFYKHNLT